MTRSNDRKRVTWEIEVDRWRRENNWSIAVARDVTILRWLEKGDVGPLARMLLEGHVPSLLVRVYLAKMLMPDKDTTFTLTGKRTYEVKYQLKPRHRAGKKGPRKKPEIVIRDLLIGERFAALMAEGKGYDQATNSIMADLGGVGQDTITDAYEFWLSLSRK